MARLVVRLKLALLRGRFRSGGRTTGGMVASVLLGVPVGLGGALAIAVGGRVTAADATIAVLVTSALAICWTVAPPLWFGVDETVDPAKLLVLPLTRRDVVVGMAAASTVGIGPLITELWLLGLVVGIAPPGPAAVLVLLACALHVLVCILSARLVTTSLSALLRTRRAKDAVGVIITLLAVGLPQLPNLLTNVLDVDVVVAGLDPVARVMGLTPFGIAGRAAGAAATGQAVTALGALAATAALVAVLAWGWMVALGRLSTTVEARGRTGGAGRDLFPRWAAWLPRDRFGATVAKELRYAAREPRLRTATTINVAFAVVLVGVAGLGIGEADAVLLTGALGLLMGLQSFNPFGIDGPAAALLVRSGTAAADVAGKNAAGVILAAPVLLVGPVVVASLAGGWRYVPVAWGTALGLLLTSQAVADAACVRLATPQPELGANAFGGRSGVGVATGLAVMAAVLLAGVLSIPVVAGVAIAWAAAPAALAAVTPAAVAYGWLLHRVGLRRAAADLAAQGPELLDRVRPA